MKINHGYQDSRAASAQDAAKTEETAAAAKTKAAKSGTGANRAARAGDEVNLSSLASVLQGALSESPERAAYLDRLASEFAAGSYQPDAAATASGIIADALLDAPDPKKT